MSKKGPININTATQEIVLSICHAFMSEITVILEPVTGGVKFELIRPKSK